MKVPSIEQLRNRNGEDFKRVRNLYDGWDKAARKKDFDECERIEKRIKDTHERNGIRES